jgi:hypothetical protein
VERQAVLLQTPTIRGTMGMPPTSGREQKLRSIVEQIDRHIERLEVADAKSHALVAKDDVLSRVSAAVGPACGGDSERAVVPNVQGAPTRVAQYWPGSTRSAGFF